MSNTHPETTRPSVEESRQFVKEVSKRLEHVSVARRFGTVLYSVGPVSFGTHGGWLLTRPDGNEQAVRVREDFVHVPQVDVCMCGSLPGEIGETIACQENDFLLELVAAAYDSGVLRESDRPPEFSAVIVMSYDAWVRADRPATAEDGDCAVLMSYALPALTAVCLSQWAPVVLPSRVSTFGDEFGDFTVVSNAGFVLRAAGVTVVRGKE